MQSTRPTHEARQYRAIRVPRDREALYRDIYADFGWSVTASPPASPWRRELMVQFSRPRRLAESSELTILQRSADQSLRRILSLERSSARVASLTAYAVGLVGTVFMAVSVFALLGDETMLSVVLGVVGIVWWVAPHVLYRGLLASRRSASAPRIDAEFGALFACAERAVRIAA